MVCTLFENCPRKTAGPSTVASEALPEVSIGYGRSHALVIGINKYSSGFSPLKTAVKDAEAIERVLREDFGFSTTLLRDAERAEIYEAVESLSRQLGPKDAVLIYYAGHGELIEETHTAYWIPVDASRGSKGNWLASEDLTRLIREMGAKDVLVISDSCYSGGLAERGAAEELTSLDNEIRIQFLKRQYEGKSRRLIASGSLEPVLDGGGDGHSVFARALLDGLGEMSHESFTASELFNEYLEQAVAGSATQIPENHYLRNSGHKRGDFLFHRKTVATESMSGD